MNDDDIDDLAPEAPAGGAADAGDALRTVQTVASTVGAARDLANAAQSGNAAGAARGLGSATDSARYIVPDHEAQQVLDGGGQAASAVGSAAEGLDELGSMLGGGSRDPVTFHLEVDGLEGPLHVRHVQLTESLNAVSTCSVTFRCTDHATARELLRKECRLSIERANQTRSFKGVVQHARIGQDVEGAHVTVRIVPALWYLSQIVTSRIHQHTTVPDLVLALVRELIGGQQRSVRNDTAASYEEHEYLVQYQESYFDFLNRLCEQEGIFWFFDHEQDHEVLVLADSASGLPDARAGDGRVPFLRPSGNAGEVEAVTSVDHDEHVGPSDVVLSGYDWTRPSVRMGDARTGRADGEPALEVYDHTDALTYHRYEEPTYREDTARVQSQMRAESLDLGRQHWWMQSSFIGARPGHLFELTGCPDGDLDGRYLIVSASSSGSGRGDGTGVYSSQLTCVPVSVPYRPERRTPRPVVAGLESATVVTDGREIQTDVHGRVKVQFHWDRLGQNDDHSSCWIRVMHNWAGEGFGTFFLPRRGMEVVVAFLGGNPDQPIVTGCVYNGANPVPAQLDAKRTQSVIRTKSSENSDGFNELRFEDEAGSEFIYTHAQKDYNEEVEHDHSTHVKHDQSNTVDVDQTETVGNDQRMTVHHDRFHTVDNDEWVEVGHYRSEIVHGNEDWVIEGQRARTITKDELLTVLEGDRKIQVQTGKDLETFDGGRTVTVKAFDNLKVIDGANRNTQVSGQYNITIDGHFKVVQGGVETIYLNSGDTYIEGSGRVQIKSDGAHLDMKPGGKVKLTASSFEVAVDGCGLKMEKGTIKLTGETETEIAGGSSSVKLDGSGATVSGPKITSSAQGVHEITGLLVKIN